MNKLIEIKNPTARVNITSGEITGENVSCSIRTLNDIGSIFADKTALANMDGKQTAYRVICHTPVDEGKSGVLFFGTSYIYPGQVGDEYFMTKGHYHKNLDTAEYHWCISGEGVILLMDTNGNCTAEKVESGSLHYIPGCIAHRLVNTGKSVLAVGACWPSDAGHDYGSIESSGFTVKIVNKDGKPVAVCK